jgi:alpha/beta hydrolase fold
MRRSRVILLLTPLLLAFLLLDMMACSSQAPTDAREPRGRVVSGAGFSHVIIEQPRAVTGADDVVHLYIDGDGRPFINRTTVAADPTPRQSQVLRWMLLDPSPSYYLGRPCYLGMAQKDNCESRWWTTDRYADPVVVSMVTAARQLLEGRPVILIGYSGGGGIALHMAGKLENVQGLITVAANLDTAAWTQQHGYTPLTVAAQPVTALDEVRRIPQMHLLGGRDKNVPVALARSLAVSTRDRFCVIERFTHDCCWERKWPQLLVALQSWNCAEVGGELLRD